MGNHENKLGLHEIKGRESVFELERGVNLIELVYEVVVVVGDGNGGAGNGAVGSDEENHGSDGSVEGVGSDASDSRATWEHGI
ncbi:hypothetical protein HN51_060213 [Arachis hypogaea]